VLSLLLNSRTAEPPYCRTIFVLCLLLAACCCLPPACYPVAFSPARCLLPSAPLLPCPLSPVPGLPSPVALCPPAPSRLAAHGSRLPPRPFFPHLRPIFPLDPLTLPGVRVTQGKFRGPRSPVVLWEDRPISRTPLTRGGKWTRTAALAAPFGPSRSCVLEIPQRCVPLYWLTASHSPLPIF